MSPPISIPLYFLLQEPLPSQYVHNFLGRAVASTSRPTDNFVPDPKVDLNEIVSDLYEKPATFKDVRKIMKTATTTNAKLGIGKLLEVFRKSSSDSGKIIEAPIFRRYRMTRIPQKFEKLMADASYCADVMDLLKNAKGEPVGLVTGLLTCENHNVQMNEGKGSEVGGKAGIPQEAILAAGGPPGVGLSVEGGRKISTNDQGHATGEGEMVLAVAYHEIWVDQSHGQNKIGWGLFFRPVQKPVPQALPIVREPLEGGDLDGFFSPTPNKDEKNDGEADSLSDFSDADDEDVGEDAYEFELCWNVASTGV